jgi:hypothetical protein
VTRGLLAGILLGAAACGQTHGPHGVPAGEGPLVGVYRADVRDGVAAPRHVKLLLWAEAPDRLHAELLGPVGGVRYTLDAGGGRAYVVDAEERIAFAGASGPEAVRALTGLPVTIEEAVAALLDGAGSSDLRVAARDGERGRLPEHLTIESGARVLELRLVRLERGSAAVALGRGEPPAGMTTRPLSELAETGVAP